MKAKFFAVLMVLGCALLIASPAMAVTCDSNPVTFPCTLDYPNVSDVAVGAITVTVSMSGDDITFTATSSVFTSLDIKAVYFNNTDSAVNMLPGSPQPVTGNWAAVNGCPPAAPGQCSGDGFGQFTSGARVQGDGNQGPTVTFHLTGIPTITPNSDGHSFAVHVSYTTQAGVECSLWVSDQPQGNGTSQAGCGSTTEIPEPGSLALLGTGLFSAVGVLRRKLLKA